MGEAEQKQVSNKKEDDDIISLIVGPFAESLFVLVPLIVISIVEIYKESSFYNIISSSEWSFAAAVLFGQALIKVVQALVVSHNLKTGQVQGDKIVLIVSLLIVIGLIPSLIILAVMLISDNKIPVFIYFQMTMFLLGLLSFLYSGALVKYVEEERDRIAKDAIKNSKKSN